MPGALHCTLKAFVARLAGAISVSSKAAHLDAPRVCAQPRFGLSCIAARPQSMGRFDDDGA